MSEIPPREPLIPAAYAAVLAGKTLERSYGDWYIFAEPLPRIPKRTSLPIPITHGLKADLAQLSWWRASHPYADMGVAIGVAVRQHPRPHACYLWVADAVEPAHLDKPVDLPSDEPWSLICVEDIYAVAAVYAPRNPTVVAVVQQMQQTQRRPAPASSKTSGPLAIAKYGVLAITAIASIGAMIGGGLPLLIIALAGLGTFIYLHWLR